MGQSISAFRGAYDFLSNFYPAPITYNGLVFQNNEAAFQAAKCPERSAEFCFLNPSEAKRLGRRVKLRNDWDQIKDSLRQSMSRKGNCWDNAPQESFFGHMKDELAEMIPNWTCFADVQRSIDDWMDYYNNDRYQWDLAKLSPNEYYRYLTTGRYPC